MKRGAANMMKVGGGALVGVSTLFALGPTAAAVLLMTTFVVVLLLAVLCWTIADDDRAKRLALLIEVIRLGAGRAPGSSAESVADTSSRSEKNQSLDA